jgi:ferritin-like metal-binding protein YciE
VFLRVFLGKSYDFVGFQESREFKGTKTALICEALRRAAIKMQPVIARTTNQRKGNMRLDTLEKLYISELRDLYSAENQLLKALPKMAKGASSRELKDAFEKHLEQTKGHVERLEQLFEQLDESPKGKTCHGMKGLIEEGFEILKEEGEDSVLDASIIVAAQKVEHYEIASYGSVRTFAHLLGKDEAARLLQSTLNEESETNEILNRLAESIVNPEAVSEMDLAGAASNR